MLLFKVTYDGALYVNLLDRSRNENTVFEQCMYLQTLFRCRVL